MNLKFKNFQNTLLKKRNELVVAIVHNVKYMNAINSRNATTLAETLEKLEFTQNYNYKLQA